MLELLQNEMYLNYTIVFVGIIWALIFLKLFLTKKSKDQNEFNFEEEYNKILNSDEYKVKRKFEA